MGDEFISESVFPVFFGTDTRTINRLDKTPSFANNRWTHPLNRYTWQESSDPNDFSLTSVSTPDLTKNVPSDKAFKILLTNLSSEDKTKVNRLRARQKEEESNGRISVVADLQMEINNIVYGKAESLK